MTWTADYQIKPPWGVDVDPSADLATGLVYAPTLAEGNGGIVGDSSGAGNVGVGPVRSTLWQPGPPDRGGPVLNFTATDRVAVANSPSLNLTGNAFTIAVRVKGASQGTFRYIFGKSNTSSKGYAIYTGSSLLSGFFCSGGSPRVATDMGTTPWDGAWHHLCYTYDGANLRGYFDGRIRSINAYSGNLDDSSTETLYLGGVGGGTTGANWFNGQLDEPRIWGRALSPDEVVTLVGGPYAAWAGSSVRRAATALVPPPRPRRLPPVVVASRRPRVVGAVAGRHLAGPATPVVVRRPPRPVVVASRRPRVVGAVAGRHLAGPATPVVAPSLAFRPIWAAGSNILIGGQAVYEKNVAASVPFALINVANGAPLPGATVTVLRTLDNGTQGAVTGTVAEKGGGQYVFSASAADLNGDSVGLLLTASGAIPVHYAIRTVPFHRTPDANGFLKVDVEDTLGGPATPVTAPFAANVTQLNSSTQAAANLQAEAECMQVATVTAETTPTTTAFSSSDAGLTSQAAAYVNRKVVWRTGANDPGSYLIGNCTGTGTKLFTVASMPFAPTVGDKFIVIT